MSDALKVLEEIEGRVKAATPGPWDYVLAYRVFVQQETGEVVTAAEEDVPPCVADAALIAHAPADLALLARLVRSVAEEECGLFLGSHLKKFIQGDGRMRCPEIAKIRENPANTQLVWCIPCRIRRELAGGVR